MAQVLSTVCVLIGSCFMLIAAIGVVRLPDVYMRMHSSTKSATLGVGFIMLGAAIYFGDLAISARALAVVLFLFATAPVAAHVIGRAAYFAGVQLSSRTLSDDLREHYDSRTHHLDSADAPPSSSIPPVVE